MNKILIIFLILISVCLKAQDYRIVKMGLGTASEKPKYDFSFNYPEIKDFTMNVTGMNMFNKHIKGIIQASNDSFTVWMADWDTTTTNHETGSYFETGDSVFYASNNLISILFYEGWYFSGAAHPNNSNFSLNYDLNNYKALDLNDLLKTGWENRVSQICIKDLMKKLYPDNKETDEWVQSGAGPDAKNFKVFNVTKEGIVITFVTYQVAAYVYGPSEVFIPYAEIKDVMKEQIY